MFWDHPLYYREDPEQPATMIFDTGEMSGDIFTTPLFRVPLLRAAGVTLKLFARTSTAIPQSKIRVLSGLGYAVTETYLPYIERDVQLSSRLRVGTGFGTYSVDEMPVLERKMLFDKPIKSGSVVHSVMETPINGLSIQKRRR